MIPLLLAGKTGGYYMGLSLRRMRVSAWTCLLIAGAPLALGVVPIPLPFPVGMIIGIGVSVYLMTKYVGAPLFPDGLLIPIAIELLAFVVLCGIGKI